MLNKIGTARALLALFIVVGLNVIAGRQLSLIAFSNDGSPTSASAFEVVFEPTFEAQAIEGLLRVTTRAGSAPKIRSSQATLFNAAGQRLFEIPVDPLGPGLFRISAALDRIPSDEFYVQFTLTEPGSKDGVQTLYRADAEKRRAERVSMAALVQHNQHRQPTPVQRKLSTNGNREHSSPMYPFSDKDRQISTSQANGGFQLLVWTAFVDYTREYPNTLDAISDHSVPYTLEETDTTDPGSLQTALQGKDVFLVPEQEAGSNDTVSSIANGFSSVLQDFVRHGGHVIALADYRGFLSGSGLMPAVTVTTTYGAGVTYQVIESDHPLTFNLGNTIRSANATDGYEINDRNTRKLVVDSENNAIVAVKELGTGEIVLIGYDYYNYNADASWLIVNAVRWASPLGPDTFGYTADDNPVSYAWIDATRGTNANISGDDQFGGPFNLGFQLPFFEKQYSQVYVGTNGLITLESGSRDYSNDPIPSTNTPNALIAPFWDDLVVNVPEYNTGTIYYRRGGTSPNRYFAVEWHGVSRLGSQDLLTFEVILYENGSIKFQYASMNGWVEGATIGIEDSAGELGLQYLYNASGAHDGTAVLFTYPSPRANILVRPADQFAFAAVGNDTRFTEAVRNIGTLGSDTVDLSVASDWAVELRNGNDTAPLRDTDSDGTPDTGSIPQGAQTGFIARVTAPETAVIGDWDTPHITAHSSRAPETVARETTLNTAIAPDFVQVFQENYASDGTTDYEIYLDMVRPTTGSHLVQVTDDTDYQGVPAVAAAPTGDVVVAWPTERYTGEYWVREIEYALFDARANPVLPTTKLVDHSTVITHTYDDWPTVAFLSNDNIAFTWSRYVGDTVNAYYAVRNRTGETVQEQVALSANTEAFPRDWPPAVAPLSNGNFVVTWEHGGPEGIIDVYYTVLNGQGAAIKPVTNLTNNSGGYDDFTPRAVALGNGRALLLWAGEFYNTAYDETCYAVIDASGNIVKPETALTNSGTEASNLRADAALLSNGHVLVAWSRWGRRNLKVQYAILDREYDVAIPPREFANPPEKSGWEVSVSADRAGHGILTWLEYRKRNDIFYALIDNAGSILTPPQSYRQGRNNLISSSWNGYGNAPLTATNIGPTLSRAYLPMISHQFGTITVRPIRNGGFEAGSFDGWTHGGQLARSISATVARSGTHSALLGDPDYDCRGGVPVGSAWISQIITVPAGGRPTLSFWYRVFSQDRLSDTKYDSFDVHLNETLILRTGNTTTTYGCDQPTTDTGWQFFTHDLSAYRGQTVELRFENASRPDGWYNTWTYVDDVQLTP